MRPLFLCAILLVFGVSAGWAGEYPLDERPMYGLVEKTPAQIEADKKYIAETLAQGLTREAGAIEAAQRGWRALANGQIAESMRRFNHAWLLDQKYFASYWGFAILLHIRDNDTEASAAMFEKAISLAPDNGDILVDYGRMRRENGQPDLAIPLFEKGVALSPNNKSAYVGLMLCYGMKGDFDKVFYWSQEGSKRGLVPEQTKEGVTEIITEVLKESGTHK